MQQPQAKEKARWTAVDLDGERRGKQESACLSPPQDPLIVPFKPQTQPFVGSFATFSFACA
jgi:hypothetical protein